MAVRGTGISLYLVSEEMKQTRWLARLLSAELSVLGVWCTGPVESDTVSPTARHHCVVSSELCCQTLSRVDGPTTRFTLRRNIARIIKI